MTSAYKLFYIGLIACYSCNSSPNIAYIRSDALVNGYTGMKEAREAFTRKQSGWQANLDSLRAGLERIPASAREERAQQQQTMARYAESIRRQSEEADQKMTQAVLDQINAYVEQYGKEHGYDLILGTTKSGNLLYGSPSLDITDELLKDMNAHYNPATGK